MLKIYVTLLVYTYTFVMIVEPPILLYEDDSQNTHPRYVYFVHSFYFRCYNDVHWQTERPHTTTQDKCFPSTLWELGKLHTFSPRGMITQF